LIKAEDRIEKAHKIVLFDSLSKERKRGITF